MISNDLFQSNYLGRDGFQWWVGQIADPVTSGWGDTKESKNKRRFVPGKEPEQQSLEHDVYERKCKVRIYGYHTITDTDGYVLKDSDLPWAHILVPSGSGTGIHGLGCTHEYQGGENVIGFFLDGDDAQQPVIIGGFGRSPQMNDVEHLKPSESSNKGECVIKPYQPVFDTGNLKHIHLVRSVPPSENPNGNDSKKETNASTGKTKSVYQDKSSSTQKAISGGNTGESGDPSAAILEKDVVVSRPGDSPVDDAGVSNIITDIQTELNGAVKTLKSLQKYKESYFDPALSQINSLSNEIGGFVKTISGYIRKLLEIVKGKLIKNLNAAWTEAQKLLPETIKPILGLTFNELLEFIICVFEEIFGEGIFDAVFDTISKSILGDVIDALLCSVENIIAELLSKFLQPILDKIKGSLDSLASLLGGIGDQFTSAISEALSLFNKILSFFKCLPARYQTSEAATWSLDGPSPQEAKSFQNILDKITIPDIPLPAGFSEEDRSSLRCDSNIGYLFPPIIDFSFGNAKAKAFVGDGKIIGIYLVEPGKGYSPLTPPAISIKQPGVYGTGGGAKAIAMVGSDGSISNVCLTSPGTGYVSAPEVAATSIAELSDDDLSLLPLPKTTDKVDAIPYLKDILIEFPGTGYTDSDTVLINNKDPSEFGLELHLDTGPTGFISEINIQNNNNTPPVFKNLPQISVISDTGTNAITIACLGFMIVESQEKDDSGNITATTADGQTITVNASDIKTSVNCFLQ